jgi:3-oxoacyl-[acyl-carrier protein] reductase
MVPAAVGDASFSLDGQIVLVTGATRGIGAAIVRRFVASGARVAITHRGSERNERLVADMALELGDDRFMAVVADAADSGETEAAVRAVESKFASGINTVILNAAYIAKRPWDEIPLEEWDQMMAVNLRGAFVAALHTIEGMRRRGYGNLITVGSVMSHIGDPRALHYVTSKGGLIAFTKSLARSEGGNGIRVNCVVPGAIRTEHEVEQGNDPAESLKNLQSLQSLQYRGAPDDIAAGCQFLASPASDFITGQALTIDGGWSDY